jgi:hypothetical protein
MHTCTMKNRRSRTPLSARAFLGLRSDCDAGAASIASPSSHFGEWRRGWQIEHIAGHRRIDLFILPFIGQLQTMPVSPNTGAAPSAIAVIYGITRIDLTLNPKHDNGI